MPKREKSKAHVKRTTMTGFVWGTVQSEQPDDPAARAREESDWKEALRSAALRLRGMGYTVGRTFGGGVVSNFEGYDEAARPVRRYGLVKSETRTAADLYESVAPVDPFGAVLAGKTAGGFPLFDMTRELGCTHVWLVGAIHGFDGTWRLARAELVEDDAEYRRGVEAGRGLASEFVRGRVV